MNKGTNLCLFLRMKIVTTSQALGKVWGYWQHTENWAKEEEPVKTIVSSEEEQEKEEKNWCKHWKKKCQDVYCRQKCKKMWVAKGGYLPIPVFLPGESQGRGSRMGYLLWGRTESDTAYAT